MNSFKDMDFPQLSAFPTTDTKYTLQKKLPGEMIPNYMPQTDFDVPNLYNKPNILIMSSKISKD